MHLTLLISLCVTLLSAQTDRATLTGVIMDPSRSVVPIAKVTLQAAVTGLTYSGLPNAAGEYTFGGMPAAKLIPSRWKWVRQVSEVPAGVKVSLKCVGHSAAKGTGCRGPFGDFERVE